MTATGEAATALDRDYFENLARFAGKHWWHVARRELAAQALSGAVPAGSVAVDAGCGIGTMLPVLRSLGAGTAVGVEPSEDACRIAVARSPVVCSVAERLPLNDGSVSTLVSMDVVEHLNDDAAGLREYARVLRPGGTLMLQVPAYRWLWSAHDELVDHKRRYTARQLASVVRGAGLRVVRETYYNAWLLPLAALTRRTPLQRLIKDSGESASYVNPAVNAILVWLSRLERALLRRMRLPFGVSILLVAEKPRG